MVLAYFCANVEALKLLVPHTEVKTGQRGTLTGVSMAARMSLGSLPVMTGSVMLLFCGSF